MSSFNVNVNVDVPKNCNEARYMLDDAYEQALHCVKSYGWDPDYHLSRSTHREDRLKEQLSKIEHENEAAEKNEDAKGESESDVIIRDITNVLLREISKSDEHKVKARAVATLYAFMTDNMEFLTADDAIFDYIEAKTLRFIQLTSGQVREFLRTMSMKRINGVDEEMEYATLHEAFGAQAEALKQWMELANLVSDANRRHDNCYKKCENRLVKNKNGIYEFDVVPRGSDLPFLLDGKSEDESDDEDYVGESESSESIEEEASVSGLEVDCENEVVWGPQEDEVASGRGLEESKNHFAELNHLSQQMAREAHVASRQPRTVAVTSRKPRTATATARQPEPRITRSMTNKNKNVDAYRYSWGA